MVVGEGGPLPPQMELAYSRLLSFDIGRAQSDASDDAQQQQEEAAGASPPHGYDVLVSLSRQAASGSLLACSAAWFWCALGLPLPSACPADVQPYLS